MFSNYLKIAFRNLVKFKGYALVNILGLAIGLACCLIIVQYLRYEWQYDKHHTHGEDIYRVSTTFSVADQSSSTSTSPSPLAAAIKEDFPEVVESARVFKAPGIDKFIFKLEGQSFTEEKGMFADSTFFRLLSYDFIAGEPGHALDEPFSIVLSKSLAIKFFGSQEAVGQHLSIASPWGEDQYTIAGVFDKSSYQTHVDADFYISAMSGAVGQRFYRLQEWGGNNLFHTYIQLAPGTVASNLEAKLPAWLEGYAADRLQQLGFSKTHFLEPLQDIYLYSDVGFSMGKSGDITYMYILGAIAIFILFIACINFMNLATAKATVRTQEVGIRKVIGASRTTLIKQFLSEAFLYTSFAIVLAYVFAYAALPIFNQLMGTDFSINPREEQSIFLLLIGFAVITTLLAGGYPAAYISSFRPAQIFRGKLGNQLSAQQVRRILVGFQFLISIALIQGVLVINEQMQYVRNKHLGFNKEQKIIIPHHTTSSLNNFDIYRDKLSKRDEVKGIGGTSSYPGAVNIEDMILYGEGQNPEEGAHSFMIDADPEYLEMMEFEVLSGRLFNRQSMADTSVTVVINEKLAEGAGYEPNNAVGKQISFNWGENTYSFRIIGVVRNFHTASLHQEMEGQAFFWDNQDRNNFLVVNVGTDNLPQTLDIMATTWQEVNPGDPFEYYFLDEVLQQKYVADQRMGGLVLWGTLLAIFISFLGLFGLATFAAERRAKEISIRKVLGATVVNIMGLLSKDFLRLVLIAFVLATPLAWYFMRGWLQDFEYHITMPWWTYALAGVLSAIIALMAIGWQSFKAARANLADTLRRD
jgi:putative ABC transport system permease protein